jgi:hypothetical protein
MDPDDVGDMNTTALFTDSMTGLEPPQLQPLPDASEAGWDRWMVEVSGAVPVAFSGDTIKVSRAVFDRLLRAQR